MDTLPPGNIFGLADNLADNVVAATHQETVEDLSLPGKQQEKFVPAHELQVTDSSNTTTISNTSTAFNPSLASSDYKVSQNAIDMLSQLFPQRKRAVLELVLKRCDSDLIKAIENISSSYKDTAEMPSYELNQRSSHFMKSAFKPVYGSASMHPKPLTLGSTLCSTAAAYPKWFVPLTFPITFQGHLAPALPPTSTLPPFTSRCTLPNCTCLEGYQLNCP